jgi:hypothetical protein
MPRAYAHRPWSMAGSLAGKPGVERGVEHRSVVPYWLRALWDAHPLVVVTIAAVAVVAAGVALIWPVTDLIAAHDVGLITGSKRAAALQVAREAVRTQLLTLGAGVFAAGALWFTARSFILSREGQVTDRYTKAIEQLGHEKLDVRIGGIYALERIARDSPRDHPTVMAVLAAFIREHSREEWQTTLPGFDAPVQATRPDVQAAMTVIGRRDITHDTERLSLSRAVLVRAGLSNANLTHVNLNHADLSDTNLTGAVLNYKGPTEADLKDADLSGVDLTGADLTGAAWPKDEPIPKGWEPRPDKPRLLRRASGEPGDALRPED